MVNHPNRGGASFQFIAFDMITGQPGHTQRRRERRWLSPQGTFQTPTSSRFWSAARTEKRSGLVGASQPIPWRFTKLARFIARFFAALAMPTVIIRVPPFLWRRAEP